MKIQVFCWSLPHAIGQPTYRACAQLWHSTWENVSTLQSTNKNKRIRTKSLSVHSWTLCLKKAQINRVFNVLTKNKSWRPHFYAAHGMLLLSMLVSSDYKVFCLWVLCTVHLWWIDSSFFSRPSACPVPIVKSNCRLSGQNAMHVENVSLFLAFHRNPVTVHAINRKVKVHQRLLAEIVCPWRVLSALTG